MSKNSGKHETKWKTPGWFLEALLGFEQITRFGLDPCTSRCNVPASFHITEDGVYENLYGRPVKRRLRLSSLLDSWMILLSMLPGKTINPVFCNPPYGRALRAWAEKCVAEYLKGARIWLLVPASVGAKWFHEVVMPHAGFYVFTRRIAFIDPETNEPEESPNFDPVLIYFGDDAQEKAERWVKNPPIPGTLMMKVNLMKIKEETSASNL